MKRNTTGRWELGSHGAASDMLIIDPAKGQQIGTVRKPKMAMPWPRGEQHQRPDRAARWLAKHDRGQRGLSLKEFRKEQERKRKQTRRKQEADRVIIGGNGEQRRGQVIRRRRPVNAALDTLVAPADDVGHPRL